MPQYGRLGRRAQILIAAGSEAACVLLRPLLPPLPCPSGAQCPLTPRPPCHCRARLQLPQAPACPVCSALAILSSQNSNTAFFVSWVCVLQLRCVMRLLPLPQQQGMRVIEMLHQENAAARDFTLPMPPNCPTRHAPSLCGRCAPEPTLGSPSISPCAGLPATNTTGSSTGLSSQQSPQRPHHLVQLPLETLLGLDQRVSAAVGGQ